MPCGRLNRTVNCQRSSAWNGQRAARCTEPPSSASSSTSRRQLREMCLGTDVPWVNTRSTSNSKRAPRSVNCGTDATTPPTRRSLPSQSFGRLSASRCCATEAAQKKPAPMASSSRENRRRAFGTLPSPRSSSTAARSAASHRLHTSGGGLVGFEAKPHPQRRRQSRISWFCGLGAVGRWLSHARWRRYPGFARDHVPPALQTTPLLPILRLSTRAAARNIERESGAFFCDGCISTSVPGGVEIAGARTLSAIPDTTVAGRRAATLKNY